MKKTFDLVAALLELPVKYEDCIYFVTVAFCSGLFYFAGDQLLVSRCNVRSC